MQYVGVMSNNITITIILALLSTPFGMAHAAKPLGHGTHAQKAPVAGGVNQRVRGTKRLLSANKGPRKQAGGGSMRDSLTPLGAADHPLQLEADLKAADSVAAPKQRRQAVAKVRKAIAKYDAKHPGQSWAKGIETTNIRTIYSTHAQQTLAHKTLRSMSPVLAAVALNVVAAVVGIAAGHDLIDVGQGDSDAVGSILMAAGYGNAVMATYAASKYQQAKGALTRAVEASGRAFVRFAEFNNLISRTK